MNALSLARSPTDMDRPGVGEKEHMVQQIAALRRYARKVLLHGETLAPYEEAKQSALMQRFLATGESFQLTRKEMVELVLAGRSGNNRSCGCHSCNSISVIPASRASQRPNAAAPELL